MTRKKTILFVEDDALIIKLYKARLSHDGYDVISAAEGEEGYQLYLKEQPDLVVLDLMIPKISGLDVLRKIRKIDKKTPIIVYTVLSGYDTKKEVLSMGANEHFIKSDIHPKILVEKIKSYFIS